jgi:hypothetical protein
LLDIPELKNCLRRQLEDRVGSNSTVGLREKTFRRRHRRRIL